MPLVLVTGSCGLIGSEVCQYFHRQGFRIAGLDNNQRAVFFGPEGDTSWALRLLRESIRDYEHHTIDVRDRPAILSLLETLRPAVIIHTAAQPSHDRAAAIPFDDFEINAAGTLNLLEAARRACPESPFMHMSTNKVYGDRPNSIRLDGARDPLGIRGPRCSSTASPKPSPSTNRKHSLFGASKVAADVMVQEYGRYFGMPTCCLRGGCLTGPNHSGVELHGFLSYLIKCNIEGREYRVFGYKGKQVRDNIHSEDVAAVHVRVLQTPRVPERSTIWAAVRRIPVRSGRLSRWRKRFTGKPCKVDVMSIENRVGDHICYYSDLRKIKQHFPAWELTQGLYLPSCGKSPNPGPLGRQFPVRVHEDSDHGNLRVRGQQSRTDS